MTNHDDLRELADWLDWARPRQLGIPRSEPLREAIAALDRAEAAVVAAWVAHDAWFGGLIDSDYDRMASIFDSLRAALRAYEDADKVADG